MASPAPRQQEVLMIEGRKHAPGRDGEGSPALVVNGSRPVFVRERSNVEDETGFIVWDAAVCLARRLESVSRRLSASVSGKAVVEVGSGTGLAGLAAAHVLPTASSVLLTDRESVLPQLVRNVELNPEVAHRTRALALDWSWTREAAARALESADPVGLVLASDRVWLKEQVRPFVALVASWPRAVRRTIGSDGADAHRRPAVT